MTTPLAKDAAAPGGVPFGPLIAIVLLSVALQTGRLLEGTPLMSANDRSRWCTVWSLVERGTYQIDEIRQRRGWDTIDKVRHEEHYYSSKPPLLSTLVAGLYWTIKHTLKWTLDDHLEWTGRLILFIVNIIPMTIALFVLARMFQRYCRSNWSAIFLTATASFGTLILPFSKTFNNHTTAFVCATLAVQTLVMIAIEGRRHWGWFASAGFFAAFACCNELPAASFGLLSFLWLAKLDWRKTLAVYVPFAIVPLAGFIYTNYLVTGGLKPFYMYYGTEKYNYVEGGVPSYWVQPKGIDQAKDDPATYLFHCTFGHHGLFSLSPVLLGVVAGWLMMLRGASPLRSIILAGAGITLLVFGFYMTRTENYNYGGVSVALRWMLWLLPFWLLALVPVVNWGMNNRVFQGVALACLGVSIFSAWYPSHGPWTQPWMFRLMEDSGVINYSDPKPAPFAHPTHTWITRLPDSAERDARYFVEFESSSITGEGIRLQILDGGPGEFEGRRLRLIGFNIYTYASDSEGNPVRASEQRVRTWVDVERFESGAPVSEFLVWKDGAPPDDERILAETTWAGLPQPAEYQVEIEEAERYMRVLVPESEAYLAKLATAAVNVTPPGPDRSRTMTYRRNVWLSDEVPFGVLQFEDSALDARSKQSRSSRVFILRRNGLME